MLVAEFGFQKYRYNLRNYATKKEKIRLMY